MNAAFRAPRGHRAARPSLSLVLLAPLLALLVAVLSACGPGVGGTGTGPIEQPGVPAPSQASALPICSSDLVSLLRCPAGSAAVGGEGTAPVLLADATGTARVHARIEGNRIELELLCQRQRFVGDWGQRSGEAPRFFGSLQSTVAAPVAASATAQLAGGGLALRLFDNAGNALANVLLLPVTGLPPSACP